jgi:ppGpp synthetase/RelA/SpoT-type nucleotidyltranferase
MSAISQSNPLTDPAAAEAMSDSEWVALHVPRFGKVRPAYEIYSKFLQKVLTEAKLNFASLAFVEVRPKGIPSFAEKILRKRRDYQSADYPLPPDPLVRLTDLCGGRVITQTADEVRLICRFIESAFDIDWPNSEDVSQRLKPTEFGYRSVHYIVQVNPAKLKTARIDVEVPAELMGFAEETLGPKAAGRPLKAEIQVRTLLEHAAASLGHDGIYKTEIQVPGRIKRQHATLSAMLEDVDTGFGHMLASLKELESNYGAHFGRKAIDEEIARLRLVLALDKNNVGLIMRLARFALASGQYEIAIGALTPLRDRGHFGIERRLGQALTEMCWDQPKCKEFLDGRSLLEEACKHIPQDSETLSMLADCVAREDDQAARELFHQAIQADATEPVTLSRYLEFETAHLANDNAVRLSTPMINAAVIRCQRQIEGNVNLPAAWSSVAAFLLMLGKPYEALDAIAHLTVLCEERGDPPFGAGGDCGTPGRPCAAGRALSRLRDTLRRLHCIRRHLEGFDWCERAVFLALAVRVGDQGAQKSLETLASNKQAAPDFKPTDKIVILAGGCSAEIQNHIDGLKPHILRACEGLSFKLVCGGTTAGISGLAGELAESAHGRITCVGYLPHHLPRGIEEDKNPARYKFRISSSGADFSPMEPLQGWTDLVSAGINATRVKVIAFAVGKIARTECAMALALGARVGIIDDISLPKERQFLDPAWQNHPNLVRLPMDAMTLRAFLVVDDLPLDAEQQQKWEKAARKAHEEYVASATPRDPSMKKWEELDPALRLSNFHQVAYWEQMLREHGLGLRPLAEADKTQKPLSMETLLGEDIISKLAEMEHGRWNVERLLRGWHRAKTKDIAQKLNPCLAPWPDVKNINGIDYQKWDLSAIRTLPAKFREVGLEIYKL